MTGHPFAALSPDAVLDAVEATGRLTDARVFALNSYENRVYQVGLEGATPIVAKFYRPGRWSREQILEEQAFTRELAEAELSVVVPLADADGNSLFDHTLAGGQHFWFALFPRQGGHAPELDNFDNLQMLGRTLGRLHAVGGRTPFAQRPALSARDFGHDSADFIAEHCIPASLKTAYSTLTRDLLAALDQAFAAWPARAIRLHGDCHPGNILWRDDTPHLVDFDDCRSGPAIQDLWMLLSGERADQLAQLSELMDGYQMFCDFDPRQLRLIEPLRSLRLMHYAAWLARRWTDPAFPLAFTWFNTERYWAEHILELRGQLAALNEEPLTLC